VHLSVSSKATLPEGVNRATSAGRSTPTRLFPSEDRKRAVSTLLQTRNMGHCIQKAKAHLPSCLNVAPDYQDASTR